jgi:hypothetical protein
MSKKALAAALAFTGLAMGSMTSNAAVLVTFPDFTGACAGPDLTCVGDTATVGPVLRVTPATTGQHGAAYGTAAVTLGVGSTFSTSFQFRFTAAGGIAPADGITFVLAKSTTGLGGAGGGIGYLGVPDSVAIEFDTFNNGEVGASNHVGVNTGGVLANNGISPYGVSVCDFGTGHTGDGCMSNGHIWTVTITYDGMLLDVFLKDETLTELHIIDDLPIDVAAALGTSTAFVGFTSGTGAGFANHDILNWRFADTATLPPVDPGTIPVPATLALLGLGLGTIRLVRRRSPK